MSDKPLVILGSSAFAEIAFEYFSLDSEYSPVAFSVERDYIEEETLLGVPIVPFETVELMYEPSDHAFFAALVYTGMNRLRRRLMDEALAKGYEPASYISTRAFVWPNVKMGRHCFIFEDNTVQPFVELGDNVVLWSGNHIGHHSKVGSNTFVSSQVVVSGFVTVGESCFLGVNATLGNNLTVGDDSFLGAGALVTRDVPRNSIVRGPKSSTTDGALERFGSP